MTTNSKNDERRRKTFQFPTKEEFLSGIEAFREHEKREAMYKVAEFLLCHFWGKTYEMTNALGVLLLTWNNAFYRYGSFNFDSLQEFIERNIPKINLYRKRNIVDYSEKDNDDIKKLCYELLESLEIDDGNMKGRRSPVAVSKALHLLAPHFFPLWDKEISKVYVKLVNSNNCADKYVEYCSIMKDFEITVQKFGFRDYNKSILKCIDEYNYSKFTKGWI